jgi:hypothetical protein
MLKVNGKSYPEGLEDQVIKFWENSRKLRQETRDPPSHSGTLSDLRRCDYAGNDGYYLNLGFTEESMKG